MIQFPKTAKTKDMEGRMKKFFVMSMAVVLAVVIASGAAYADTPVRKLGRGFANVLTCPMEIPYQMTQVYKNEGAIASWSYGLFKGIGMTFVRAVVGVYEVGTFLIPIPKEYGPVLRYPEFFFEEGTF